VTLGLDLDLDASKADMTSVIDQSSTVLVTGGTGSFGSTMVRRLLDRGVGEVRVFSRDELKQHEMRTTVGDDRVSFYIGDVRDYDSVERATRGVDLVFHAAALKQVPSCEFFPMEAVRTNVLGSSNVIEASNANGVSSVVCLGTDKAVYPVNAMGMSKAMMEKTAQAFARSNPTAKTVVSTVRYGNVMCSRGSVIPLFVEQVRAGGPMTLTDPGMTRFLMSLEEAVVLVEHAFAHAKPGDLFVRKAPASTVEDLATAVAHLMDADPQLKVIGTRHGEKLYETLATREELARAEDQGDFYRVPVDSRDLNYHQYFDEGDVTESRLDDYHSHNTERLDVAGVKRLLAALPAFRKLVGERNA
jgi:UDP-glucose 4-epimerase